MLVRNLNFERFEKLVGEDAIKHEIRFSHNLKYSLENNLPNISETPRTPKDPQGPLISGLPTTMHLSSEIVLI
jgi:hypothetical protein